MQYTTEQRATHTWIRDLNAKTVHQARTEWQDYLPFWKERLLMTFAHLDRNARMGWINDASFWETFWNTANKRSTRLSVATCALQAASAGSNSFFKTMPTEQCAEIERAFLSSTTLFDPLAFKAFESRLQLDIHQDKLRTHQCTLWRSIHWRLDPNSKLLDSARRTLPLEDVMRVVDDAVDRYNLDNTTQLHLLGHLMLNAPRKIMRTDVVACLRAGMGDHWSQDIDWPLLEACSGYARKDHTVLKSLANVARSFAKGHSMDNKKPSSPVIQMLLDFYDITTPLELYQAARNARLLQNDAAIALPPESCSTSMEHDA